MADETTNTETTGNEVKKPTTAKEKMAHVDSLLDTYENKLGLPTFTETAITNEISEYLAMDKDRLEKLSPEECAEIAVRLDQASFTLQRAINREISHVTWATEVLKISVAGRTKQYHGSFQQQEMQAINEDGYTRAVFNIKGYAQQRVDRLNFLSSSLHRLGEKLSSLGLAKSRKV